MSEPHKRMTNVIDKEHVAENDYSINRVAEMLDVDEWTIRLWADRFEMLTPRQNRKGDILFHPADVKKIELISKMTKKKGVALKDVRKVLTPLTPALAMAESFPMPQYHE